MPSRNSPDLRISQRKAKDWEATEGFVSSESRGRAIILRNAVSSVLSVLPPETLNIFGLALQLIALERRLLACGETSPFDLGCALNQFGKFLIQRRLIQEAIPALEEAVQIQHYLFDESLSQNFAFYLCKYYFCLASAHYQAGSYDSIRECTQSFFNIKGRYDWNDRWAENEVGRLWAEEVNIIRSWGLPSREIEPPRVQRRQYIPRIPSAPSTLRSSSSSSSSTLRESTIRPSDLEWYEPPPGL